MLPPANAACEPGESSAHATSSSYTANNSSQTEIKVEEYLENFVHLNKGDETLTWSVKIYPKGNGENNKDFVFLCLNRVASPASGSNNGGQSGAGTNGLSTSGNPTAGSGTGGSGAASTNCSTKLGKIGFKSRFTLRNAEAKEIEMRIHPNPSHSDYVSYIKRDVLFPQILPQDVIVVSVEIDVAVETVTTCQDDNASPPNSDAQLIDDYMKLLRNDGAFSDFVIRAGGREMPVHRAILAARSEVLNAMLSHDTDESKTGKMEIHDLDADVVYEMLCFIYSGRCPRGLNEMAGELLIAADKYSLSDLKQHCEKALKDELAVENACQMLILSDVHSAPRLRERAVEFILANARDVTTTSGWQVMLQSHPALVTEIVQNFGHGGGATTITSSSSSSTSGQRGGAAYNLAGPYAAGSSNRSAAATAAAAAAAPEAPPTSPAPANANAAPPAANNAGAAPPPINAPLFN